ncbi:hypothetical protein F9C28_11000 [Shimwellia pseudoproteus]|uniref:hypothetical protein n=1 Tax=Shimwellia pseudoproteus TaxID=570012 RepID=UPI0018EDE11F|nr:hypothetical protein [Shimwellia pseudoproteus]MBJ3815441.1 hypothetical protein [Shimwellia pseudoproteus]
MTTKNLFSSVTARFYPPDQLHPDDAIEISAGVEDFLREAILWGANTFTVARDSASVSYPPELDNYVSRYHAPTHYPEK